MHAFHVDELLAGADGSEHVYRDFLAVDALSVGISLWPAASRDEQRPHREDEVYCVLAGRGRIIIAGDNLPVRAGSVIYVPAGVEHHFADISEELRVLVFWSPPHLPPRLPPPD